MAARKSIGLNHDYYARPFLQQAGTMGWSVIVDSPASLAIRLRENSVDAAMISPIDYAREGSLYRIVPRLAVSSRDASNAVILQFRQGIRTITSLAVRPHAIGDIILAKIILMEEFDVSPVIVPVGTAAGAMLERADAALITGDEALLLEAGQKNSIDLVEAWGEMTDLPYVHGMFCFREGRLFREELRAFRAFTPVDTSVIEAIANDAAERQSLAGRNADSLR